MKKSLLIIILALLMGCDAKESDILKIQNEYLKVQVGQSLMKLRDLVYQKGYTTKGEEFLKQAITLVEKHDSLENLIRSKQFGEFENMINEYMIFANSNIDTIGIRPDYFLESIKYLNQDNTLEVENSLILFTKETIDKYRDQYTSNFYNYDMVKPILVSNQTNEIGQPYYAEILLEATNSGITPRISVDFLDDENGFFLIPVTSDGRGQLKILKLTERNTKLKIRVDQIVDGKEKYIESIVEIDTNN